LNANTNSSWRYDAPGKAVRYRDRSPRRNRAEARLLKRLLGPLGRGLGRVLDVPCGTGRLCGLLDEAGTWHGADGSLAMARLAQTATGRGVLCARIEALPFADRAFDTVVCFRYLHHVEPALQESVVAELQRIANRNVVLSAFHPRSAHRFSRELRATLSRSRRLARFPTPPRRLDAWLAARGFAALGRRRQGLLSDLWVGAWQRREPRGFAAHASARRS